MKLTCTLIRLPGGGWLARYTGSDLGPVDVSGSTRDEALTKMRNELQYRTERCPCSGVSGPTVELEAVDAGADVSADSQRAKAVWPDA